MKRSKLLFLVPCLTTIASVPFASSCGKKEWTNEDIADAIFAPTHIQNPVKITSFIDEFKKLSLHEQQAELIYDLYGLVNEPIEDVNEGKRFEDLYKNNTVGITSNITRCSLEVKDGKLIANFLGYINFVFLKDYSESEKKGDYLMITYDIYNLEVTETNCGLMFIDPKWGPEGEPEFVIGFIKMKISVDDEEHMIPIPSVNTAVYTTYNCPTNSHNWV